MEGWDSLKKGAAAETAHLEKAASKIEKTKKVREYVNRGEGGDMPSPAKKPKSAKEKALDEAATHNDRSLLNSLFGSVQKKQKSEKEDAKERAALIRKVERYAIFLPSYCGGIHANPNWTLAEAQYYLEQCRARVAEKCSGSITVDSFFYLLQQFENMAPQVGVEWDIKGMTSVLEQNKDELNPELAEMCAELAEYMHQPWYIRLPVKLAKFAKNYSDAKAGVRGAVKVEIVDDKPSAEPSRMNKID
jgi:hypothetical protein